MFLQIVGDPNFRQPHRQLIYVLGSQHFEQYCRASVIEGLCKEPDTYNLALLDTGASMNLWQQCPMDENERTALAYQLLEEVERQRSILALCDLGDIA